MKKFQNKYRIPSARAQWWDYGNDGAYFITICTKDRECCFGDIVDGEIKFSHVGLLADVFWHEIKNHAKNITLDVFQVMPNHIHGVLVLNNNERGTDNDKTTHNDGNMNSVDSACSNDITVGVETTHALSLEHVEQTMNDEQTMHDVKTMDDVETTHALSLQCAPEPPSPGSKRFQHQGSNTISSIIGSYKSAVTKHAHRLGFEFEWQERFHDIIIRDEESYIKIVDYIKNNPAKWDEDKFNPANNKTE
jgi:putative transposase